MAASSSRKKKDGRPEDWKDYPLLTQRGIDLIRTYTHPRISLGEDRYGSYKEYGEDIWRIGYGSTRIKKHWVGAYEKATRKEVEAQFVEDLKEFSQAISLYIFTPLNETRKAAILSFAHSIGIQSFKTCRLLELINSTASRNAIIKEWSPYINKIWASGGDLMVSRRRVELDLYLAPDKEIPTFTNHKCELAQCLLNLPETWNGSPTQIKGIEYLERKLQGWDPSGEVLRRFFRYWNEKPGGLSSDRP